MCLAQGPQRSDAGEAQTRGPSVSSQALYHWATALPQRESNFILIFMIIKENIRNNRKITEKNKGIYVQNYYYLSC